MADGLLGMAQGQQAQAQPQGGLFGGAIQTPSNIRRAERNRLMGDAIQLAQSPSALMASGAAQAGLGIGRALGFETEGDRTARIVEQVQRESLARGLTTDSDPMATFDFAQRRFQELGAPELATRVQQQAAQMAPKPQESILRVKGGTDQAKQAAERFPGLGIESLGENEFATINLTGDRATGIDVERDEQELPDEFRTLDLQARAAGYSRGSPEYERFMATGGDVPSPRQPGVPDVENLTVAEEQVDKAYGKEYVEWVQGKSSDAQRGAATIANAIQRLESGEENLTGPIIGNAPDQYLATFNKAALDVKQNVEEVVQRNLREILGAQFTEAEGERLIARAYDPKLPAEVNASRLRSLLTQMESAIQSKNDQAAYYQKFGTLKGYEQEIPTKQDFFDALKGEPKKEESERDSKRDITSMNGQELLNLDVNNLNESELNQYNSRIDALMEGNR